MSHSNATVIPNAARVVRAARLLACAIVLVLAGLAATRGLAERDLTSGEAYALWAIRDPQPARPASLTDAARAALANAREALNRAGSAPAALPYLLALDGWALLSGESAFAARAFNALLGLLAAALLLRVLRRLTPQGPALLLCALIVTNPLWTAATGHAEQAVLPLVIVVALAAWLVRRRRPLRVALSRPACALMAGVIAVQAALAFAYRADWSAALDQLAAQRQPTEIAITHIDPASPAGYHAHRGGLRAGMALDLAWQTPDALRMLEYAAALTRADAPVWAMMPARLFGEAGWNAAYALRAAGRAPDLCLRLDGDFVVARWVLMSGRAAIDCPP
jgi:hypothetical protein